MNKTMFGFHIFFFFVGGGGGATTPKHPHQYASVVHGAQVEMI